MTFDELYGEGKFAALVKLMGAVKRNQKPEVIETPGAMLNTVDVTARWPDDTGIAIIFTAERVLFSHCSQDLEMHRGLDKALPAAMKALGVKSFHTYALDPQSKQMLTAEHGFKERGSGSNSLDWTL